MAKNDKIVVAFLVSVGMFSVLEAQQYVGSLSRTEKTALKQVVVTSTLSVTDGGTVPAVNSNENPNSK